MLVRRSLNSWRTVVCRRRTSLTISQQSLTLVASSNSFNQKFRVQAAEPLKHGVAEVEVRTSKCFECSNFRFRFFETALDKYSMFVFVLLQVNLFIIQFVVDCVINTYTVQVDCLEIILRRPFRSKYDGFITTTNVQGCFIQRCAGMAPISVLLIIEIHKIHMTENRNPRNPP